MSSRSAGRDRSRRGRRIEGADAMIVHDHMDNGASHDIPLPPEGRLEAVPQASDTLFTWDYAIHDPALLNLYEKGKRLQWNASTDIDWSISVDPEQFPDFLPPEAVNAVLNPPEQIGRAHV